MSGKSLRTIGDFVVIGTLDLFGVNKLASPSLPVMGQRGFFPKAFKGMDEVPSGEFHLSWPICSMGLEYAPTFAMIL